MSSFEKDRAALKELFSHEFGSFNLDYHEFMSTIPYSNDSTENFQNAFAKFEKMYIRHLELEEEQSNSLKIDVSLCQKFSPPNFQERFKLTDFISDLRLICYDSPLNLSRNYYAHQLVNIFKVNRALNKSTGYQDLGEVWVERWSWKIYNEAKRMLILRKGYVAESFSEMPKNLRGDFKCWEISCAEDILDDRKMMRKLMTKKYYYLKKGIELPHYLTMLDKIENLMCFNPNPIRKWKNLFKIMKNQKNGSSSTLEEVD